MRVLVTGGAGFIGSHVAEAYLHRGDEVVVLDNLSRGRRSSVAEGIEFQQMDIREERAAELIRHGRFDVVNHHAAQMDVRVSVSDPRYDADVNLMGLLNLLEACRAADVGRFVYVSSGGVVYGQPNVRPTPESEPKLPESPYGVTKLAGEQYLYYYHKGHGLDYVALRYANVYGPRQDPRGEAGVIAVFSSQLLNRRPLTIYGDGEQTRDFLYVRDAVAANLAVSGADPSVAESLDQRAFNVGTGTETSVRKVAEELVQIAGRAVPIQHAQAKPGEVRDSSLDASRLRDLGWRPATDLQAGLNATFSWIRSEFEAAPEAASLSTAAT